MSTKQKQILKIDPAEKLTFTGPFHRAVSSVMTLTNPSDQKVRFKIKTTAPTRYCVKPNSGVIGPQQTSEVSVSLQAFDFDPQVKNRHKFMVQSMFAPTDETNEESLWKEAKGSQLMESKLKCLFFLPESTGGVSENFVGNRGFGQSTGGIRSNNGDIGSINENVENISANNGSVSVTASVESNVLSRQNEMIVSKTAGDDMEANLERSVKEMKSLKEEVSAIRQENIQLKVEGDALRHKRLAAGGTTDLATVSTQHTGAVSCTVHPRHPDFASRSTTYLYLAFLVLIIGIILGRILGIILEFRF